MSHKLLLFVCVVSISLSVFGQVERLAADNELKGAGISIFLADAITGEELENLNGDVLLCPASVWKLATTAAALENLGPGFTFKTQLAYTGSIQNGVLEGDILIIGGNDPTLGSRFFRFDMDSVLNDWASAISSQGIDSINGSIIANGSGFTGPTIPGTRIWEDMANYYGTGICGLNFNDNTYFISFRTPDEPDELAEILDVYPIVPGLEIESEVSSSTIQSDMAFIYGSPLDSKRVVRGTLPLGKERFPIKGSIPDPLSFTAFHLRERLRVLGISSKGFKAEPTLFREQVTFKAIRTTESPNLKDIVKHVNERSDNLMADGLLVQLGALNGISSLETGLEELKDYLSGIWSDSPFYAYDGSGLSRFNAVSAEQLSQLIIELRRSDVHRKFLLEELPLAGKEGSVKWFGKGTNLVGNVRLKSGSMKNVRAYAGTITTFSGRELAFAAIVNNYPISGTEVRDKIVDWLLRVYGRY